MIPRSLRPGAGEDIRALRPGAGEDAWLRVKSFDYARLSDRLAVVRLQAALGAELGPPAGARLIIRRGEETTSHAAAGSVADRGARSRRRASPDLLWRVTFAVDLALVEYPRALFELTALERIALELPAPDLCVFSALNPAEVYRRQLPAGLPWRRLVALSTAVAVATASTAPVGLAAAASLAGPTSAPGTAPPSKIHPAGSGLGASPQSQRATLPVGGTRIARLSITLPASKPPGVSAPVGATPTGTTGPQPPAPSPARSQTDPTTPADPASSRSTHVRAPHCVLQISTPTKRRMAIVEPKPAKSPRTATRPTCIPRTPPRKPQAGHGKTQSPSQGSGTASGPTSPGHRRPAKPHTPVAPHSSGGSGLAPITILTLNAPKTLAPSPKPKPVPSPAPTPATPAQTVPVSSSVWTPGVNADPVAGGVLSRLSGLFVNLNQPPGFLVPVYKAAGRRYHVPWQVLAAINWIETDYGRNLNVSSAGAIGWMQFMPATWRQYGVDADGRGTANPNDPTDAIFAAARYLKANGARHDLRGAIFAYNHAAWYVEAVMWRAQTIVDSRLRPNSSARLKIGAMLAMANLLKGEPYIFGGGHSDWLLQPGYDCSGFVSAVLHAAGYLTIPVNTQALPSQPGIVTGPGRYVTIFDRTDASSVSEDHVILLIRGQWWESGGSSAAGGRPSVHRMKAVSAGYLATFNLILHPRGL